MNKVDKLYKKLIDISAEIGKIQAECPHKKSSKVPMYICEGSDQVVQYNCSCEICRKTWIEKP